MDANEKALLGKLAERQARAADIEESYLHYHVQGDNTSDAMHAVWDARKALFLAVKAVIIAQGACNYQDCIYNVGDTDLLGNLSLLEFAAMFDLATGHTCPPVATCQSCKEIPE